MSPARCYCGVCKRRLDDPADPELTADCGGDCLLCMAYLAGDSDCKRKVESVMAGDPCDQWEASS